MPQAQAVPKAEPLTPPVSALEASLSQHLPKDIDAYISTLGRNRRTGVINDPYRAENLPAGFIARAVSRDAGELNLAFAEGWIPFQPDQVTNKSHETDKVLLANYEVVGGYVVVGYLELAMVMCYAHERIINARRNLRKQTWNEQFSALAGEREQSALNVKDEDKKRVVGAFTSDAGHQFSVSHSAKGFEANLESASNDLFRQAEEA